MIVEKLASMGLNLPQKLSAVGSYVPVVMLGNTAFVSGQIALDFHLEPAQLRFKGKVGNNISIEDAKSAAALCVINALAQLNSAMGSLEPIKRIVKITGYINCEPSFAEHSTVMNGASELILKIFGDIGRHARVAIGANSLPLDSPVELDMIAEIDTS
jgi:enamine deaminase RidA (YjgF/YER057c/UK114 family)